MIDMSCIYRNPIIPPGDYLVRVDDVSTEQSGTGRPLICVRVSLAPGYEDLAGTTLSVLIHPTAAANGVYDAFLNALGVVGTDYSAVEGKYVVVSIGIATHKGKSYSAIYFRWQTEQYLEYAQEALKAEQIKSKAQAVC